MHPAAWPTIQKRLRTTPGGLGRLDFRLECDDDSSLWQRLCRGGLSSVPDQAAGRGHPGGEPMMTGITFFSLNGIQRDTAMNDTRYARDLGLLLAGNVTELVAEGRDRELANVTETFWRSSRSLRYIFFADPDGIVYLGIPISGSDDASSADMRLSRRLELPDELRSRPQNPLVRQHITPQGQVTDVFVPLVDNKRYLGVLALGVNPNETALASAALTREVTVAVFISIWVLVILGAVFNALTITVP